MKLMIELILSFQQGKYDLRSQPAAMEFLSSPKFIAELLPFYEQENYRISLQLEPREQAPSPRDATGVQMSPASATPVATPADASGPTSRGFFSGAATTFWRTAGARADDGGASSAGSAGAATNATAGGSGSASAGSSGAHLAGPVDLASRPGSVRRPDGRAGDGLGTSAPVPVPAPVRRAVNLLDDSEMDPPAGTPIVTVVGSYDPTATAAASLGVNPVGSARPMSMHHSHSNTPIALATGAGDSASDNDGSDHEDHEDATAVAFAYATSERSVVPLPSRRPLTNRGEQRWRPFLLVGGRGTASIAQAWAGSS